MADFYLPSFGVQGGDFGGGELLVVQERGQQPDDAGLDAAAAGAGHDFELDQAGDGVRQAGRGLVPVLAAPPGAHAVRFVQHDQLRAVRQGPDGLERDRFRAVLDAPAQVRADGGEPDPPVHGEEPPVGEVEHPFPQRGLQRIYEGILPVVVAADCGADPPVRRGADVGDDAEQGVPAAGGHPERLDERGAAEQRGGGAVEGGDLHAVPQFPDAQLGISASRVQLECPPRHVLAGQCAGLGQRRAARDRGAGLEAQTGHGERGAQDLVVALPGEQAACEQAQQGRLRVQRPVQLVAVRNGGHCLVDNASGEKLLQQGRPVQALQFLQPQARPGRHPGGQVRPKAVLLPGPCISSRAGLRRRHAHGKMAGQRSSCPGRFRVSAPHVLPGASLLFRPCGTRMPHRDHPVAKSSPTARKPGTARHNSRKLRAVLPEFSRLGATAHARKQGD